MKGSLLRDLYEQCRIVWQDPRKTPAQRRAAMDEYSAAAHRTARTSGHDLWRIWRRFKDLHSGTSLAAHDSAVRSLARWWKVRYPGFPAGVSVMVRLNLYRVRPPPPPPSKIPRTATDSYDLCLEDLDELFARAMPLEATVDAIRQAVYPNGVVDVPDLYRAQNRHALGL